jgi:phosphoesterase RecJ-like protein
MSDIANQTANAGRLRADFSEIASVLRDAESILAYSHVRPDGDAIGSVLALGMALKESGKTNVTLWSEDGVPESLAFLDADGMISKPDTKPRTFDTVVALDTAAYKRAGDTVLAAITPGATLINIDHHASNDGYGQLNHIDPSSPATGQILFEFLATAKLPITPSVAAALYAAIATDTGFFQYPGTTDRTHEIIAELIRKGADAPAIAARLNDNSPRRRFDLMRVFLDRAKFDPSGRIAWSVLPIADAKSVGAKPEDTEGLIDLIRGVEGVVVAVFFEEMPEEKVRISTRSKSRSVDVSAICAKLGGGGHPAAAGARFAGTLAEAESRVLKLVNDALD